MATPETVRVYARDENDDPLVGVLVRAYDDTDTFVTQNVTALVGGEAYCEITLDGDPDPNPIGYTLRLSKDGVAFDGLLGDDSRTPQSIEVYSPASGSPTGTNYFTVQGQTFTRPAATDPRLCRCSGFFKDIHGRPYANLDIKVLNTNSPLVVDDAAVLGSKEWGRTDEDGYIEFDLYRNGEYRVRIESLEIQLRVVCVPDAPSCDLVDLLFPTVATIGFNPDPVSVAEGASVDVTITITDTTGLTHDLEDGDVVFTVNDAEIATAAISEGVLRITGVSPGSTTITPERSDDSIVVVPDPSFSDLSVTVT